MKHSSREVNQIKSNYRIYTTKKKVFLYFFIAAIAIFLVFNWLFYRLYSANIEQILITESKNGLSKTMEYVDMILSNMEYTADVVQSNLQIQSKLEFGDFSEPNDYIVDREIVDTLKSIITYSSNSAASIDLYLYKNKKLYTSDYGVYSNQPGGVSDYYYEIGKEDKKFALTDEYRKKLSFLLDRNYEQITMVRPLYVLSTGVKSGVLAVNFDKYYIQNIIQGKSNYSNMILDAAVILLSVLLPRRILFQGRDRRDKILCRRGKRRKTVQVFRGEVCFGV
ncbi:cache domain-containing protein [Acetivibrio straminisolvens]|uniref:Two-component sensor histidine kinase n=1 Tax=Acetivibrio straminisolvens JCM 21531 TaxID=1294263 RepID=W4V3B4_9FIRM|nr:cache domain-containing protein [Acetivibrio straminisolvens]GAE87701.1 hypothetical protein JCM21531_1094 [Acetivibrio straminisolvens JCM 21531]